MLAFVPRSCMQDHLLELSTAAIPRREGREGRERRERSERHERSGPSWPWRESQPQRSRRSFCWNKLKKIPIPPAPSSDGKRRRPQKRYRGPSPKQLFKTLQVLRHLSSVTSTVPAERANHGWFHHSLILDYCAKPRYTIPCSPTPKSPKPLHTPHTHTHTRACTQNTSFKAEGKRRRKDKQEHTKTKFNHNSL